MLYGVFEVKSVGTLLSIEGFSAKNHVISHMSTGITAAKKMDAIYTNLKHGAARDQLFTRIGLAPL